MTFAELFAAKPSPLFIAEVSANHLGDLSRTKDLISAIALAGADFVKFQHVDPGTITVRSLHSDFRVDGGTAWDGRQLYDLYQECAMPWEWTQELSSHCESLQLPWLSTAFDTRSADFLAEFDVFALKIASCELVDVPLVRHVAAKQKPVILSTGMASVEEIDQAVKASLEVGSGELCLLRCNSSYPANPEEMDLISLPTMSNLWSVPVGLSDHTLSPASAITASVLGAQIIEKHVTLSRSDGGPDASFSLEPQEFREMVHLCREAVSSIGVVRFGPSPGERSSVKYRRSLRAVRQVRAGQVLQVGDVASIRPSGGLPPSEIARVIGRRALLDLAVGDPITIDAVDFG